jgi:molybdate transport system regulatory protein
VLLLAEEDPCLYQYQLKGRIWIEIDNKTFIGEGKANLLRKTAQLGSLRKASYAVKMSYRQAWYSLNQMNKSFGKPVILLHRGGKNGGIAQITEFGKEVLNVFEKSQYKFDGFLKKQTIVLNSIPEHMI